MRAKGFSKKEYATIVKALGWAQTKVVMYIESEKNSKNRAHILTEYADSQTLLTNLKVEFLEAYHHKDELEKLRAENSELKSKLLARNINKRISECKHEHIKTNSWDTADCEDCGKHFSWYCPPSPTKECDYNQEDGSYDDDNCRYCGQPEERK